MATQTAPKPGPTLVVGQNYNALRIEADEQCECVVKLARLAVGNHDYMVTYQSRHYNATWDGEVFVFTY